MAPSRQGPRKPASARSGRVREAERGAGGAPASQPRNGSSSSNGSPVGNGRQGAEAENRKEEGSDVPADIAVAAGVPSLPADCLEQARGAQRQDPSPQFKAAATPDSPRPKSAN